MFKIDKDEIYVSDTGSKQKYFVEMQNKYKKKKKFFKQLCKYIYLMYYKGDSHLSNVYRNMSHEDKSTQILEDYPDFFEKEKFDKEISIDKNLMSCEFINKFVTFYISIQYTENEKLAETFKKKMEHYRNLIQEPTNDAKQDLEYSKVLVTLNQHYEEYKMKAEAEDADQEEGGSLYLFEDPEKNKPSYLKL